MVLHAKIQDETAQRLSEITGRPISKGVDKAINDVCDKLETLEEKDEKPSCWVDADKTEKQGDES